MSIRIDGLAIDMLLRFEDNPDLSLRGEPNCSVMGSPPSLVFG